MGTVSGLTVLMVLLAQFVVAGLKALIGFDLIVVSDCYLTDDRDSPTSTSPLVPAHCE